MTKPNIQINDLVREMTDEEYGAYLADQDSNKAQVQEKIDLRKSALTKLKALGLTEEEITAL